MSEPADPATSLTVPRRTAGQPVVIAHRGASADQPENTLPAFLAAWDAGAQWVEADTQPTADGVPVLLHDSDLDRTTSGSGPVRDHDIGTVAALDAGGWFDRSAAAGDSARAAVPRLSDLLALLTADRRVLLEIKGEHTADQIAAVLRACRASAGATKVFLQSFDAATLKLLHSLEPRAPFGLLVEGFDDDPIAQCRDIGAAACNPDHRAVLDRPATVCELQAAGLSVSVWTADEPAAWVALTRAGVDGIITNRPAELLRWQRRSAAR